LTHLLLYIARDGLDGSLHVGHHTLGLLEPLQTCLTEIFVLGNGADRVDVALDIPGNELPVATHTALPVHKVVGVAKGTDALGDLLSLRSEALILLASRGHCLRALCQARRRLWGTPWTTLGRLAVGVVESLVHPLERLFRLRDGLCGSPLFDDHRRCDRFTQFRLHMEEVRRVRRSEVLFHIGQQSPGASSLVDWITRQLRPARACSISICHVS
jgi:hypothetical protein